MIDNIWIILIFILVFLGIKLSFKERFQNFKLYSGIKTLDKKSLCLSLGVKAGVGTIIGTTMAIFIGGEGAIFWMWVFTILTSSIVFFESKLGNKYKKKLDNDTISGPYFYIRYGFNNKTLAVIFNIIFIITYSYFFLMIQTNTINEVIKLNITGVYSNIIIAIFMFLILFSIVFFSLNKIIELLNKLVPIMCILFLVVCLVIVFKNYEYVMPIFKSIINSAFTFKGITVGLLIGIKRSIFLNELLIGTTSVSSGVSTNGWLEEAKTQTLGTFFLSFVMCTLTSLVVLIFMSDKNLSFNTYNELLNNVFIHHLGYIGSFMFVLIIILFAITTIISGYYIGLSNVTYMTKNKVFIFLFKLFMLLFTMSGLIINTSLIWDFLDVLMLILITINVICIFKLSRRKI